MLAYLFLSKVVTLKQSNSLSVIFPYVHFCLTTGHKHWHSSICWHSIIRSLSTFKVILIEYYFSFITWWGGRPSSFHYVCQKHGTKNSTFFHLMLLLYLSCCHIQIFGYILRAPFPSYGYILRAPFPSYGYILRSPFPSYGCSCPLNFTYLKSKIWRGIESEELGLVPAILIVHLCKN